MLFFLKEGKIKCEKEIISEEKKSRETDNFPLLQQNLIQENNSKKITLLFAEHKFMNLG